MAQKTVQQLDAYIKATAVVYDHSNAKLISRKTKVKPRRKQAFLSVLHYRKTSSDDCSAKRRPSKRLIRRQSKQTHESQSDTKGVKQKLQVFVRTPSSYKSKTLYFELHPETSVSSLKETIQKKIGVEARHQRLYIRENVQLCDLLTLAENGVDKDELISLRLSLDDANDDDVQKDKSSIDDEYLKDLSSKIESSWKELAEHLGYEEAEIADIQTTNEGSTKGGRHMLLTWWEKTTDHDDAAQKLRRALEAIGLTDFAQNVPVTRKSRDKAAGAEPKSQQDAGVNEENKQNGAASTEEEKLKKEQVGDQDKPQLISRRYVQVFIHSRRSQKPKIMCLQVDPETPVLILKVIISEKIGVQPQQQRLFIRRNCRNFELHNLLTLHDCGIHQDENISLRLCTDGLLGGGLKDKHTVDDQFFRDLASSTESSWEELAKSLGYEEAEIKQIQTSSQENKERSLQMLLSWWRKQTNREEGFQKLRDALNLIGRAELALTIPTDEQQRMKQEELGNRGKPQSEEQVGGAKEQSKQKWTTSSNDQRTRQVVGHRDNPKPEVQVGGAKEQSKQKGTTSSEGQRPGQEEVVHRGKPQSEEQVGGAQAQSKQKGTASSDDQRTRQVVGHRDNPQPEVQVVGAKEQSKQKGTTSSERQKPEQEENVHRGKPQSEVQVEELSKQKESTTSEGQRPGLDEQDHLQRHEEGVVEEQGRQKQIRRSDEEQKPSQEEVGHRDTAEVQNQVAGAGKQNSPNVSMTSSHSTSFKNRLKRSVLSLLPKRKKARKQKLGQEQMGDEHSRQADNKRAGFHEERKTHEGTSSSDGLSPKQEYVGHRDKLQQDVLGEGVKEHSNQKETTSTGDQRLSQEEAGHEAKHEPEVEVRVAREQRQQKGTTSSERQRQSQQEAGGTEPNIQKERMQSYEDHGLKMLTHQDPSHGQVGVTPRNPSEIQETVVTERTSQIGQIMQSSSSIQDIAPVGLQLETSSLSPAVPHCGPVQHVSVDSVHIGGANNPTFLGPVYQPTLNITQNVTMPESSPADSVRAQSSPSDAADQCRSELKDRYTTTGSYVQLIPWVDDDMKHIRDIYTELQMEQGDQDDIEGFVKEYGDIFLVKTTGGNVIKRAILCGSAGMGKSTIIGKIAYDWAKGIALKTFTLLFVLKMSALDQTSDLVDSVFNQLLSDDTNVNKSDLKGFIKSYGSRVLILIDGFDEFRTTNLEPEKFGPILKMLNRKFGKDCFVVVTTRPSHFDKLKNKSLIEKPFTHVNVLGFRMEDIGQYVRRFFSEKLDIAEGLLDRIQSSDVLSDLARSPMILLLMCLLWRGKATLPDTLSRLFSEAIKYIFRRKMPDISEEAISKTVIAIGKVALEGLVSPERRLSFQEGEFEKSVLDKAIQAGILTSQRVMNWLDTHNNVQFIHKTLQEYCAAIYCQSLFSKGDGEFQKILDIIGISIGFEYMLRFCCGDNPQCTKPLLQTVLDYYDMDELAINCYFESRSRDLLSVDFTKSVLSASMVINNYSNDSMNSLVWFLQHVADQTERLGVDYLAEVRDLYFYGCDLSRLSAVLGLRLASMKNLRNIEVDQCKLTRQLFSSLGNAGNLTNMYLKNINLGGFAKDWAVQLRGIKCLATIRLESCSLNPRDVIYIASSVGEMPNLENLDLSHNGDLGGNAGAWAASLQRIIFLKSLQIQSCNINEQDIPHIASSVVEMPNLADLNLSRNMRLGGNAGTWATSLHRMIHLKSLNLSSCHINEQDIPQIASSVRDMPNLTYLNLSDNEGLGGKAGTWAASLQSMIHLKKLDMRKCGINGGDVKCIAASISRMRNLVDGDFSNNAEKLRVQARDNGIQLRVQQFSLSGEDMADILQSFSNRRDLVSLILDGIDGLGCSADVWTPPLQNLTNLMELTVSNCSLQITDIDHINAAVSGKPNLTNLNISHNKGFGGNAGRWAASLQRMMHIKKLDMSSCNIHGRDVKYIAESVSRMGNLLDCVFGRFEDEEFHVKPWNNGIQLSIEGFSLTGEDMADILQSFSNRRDLVSLILCGIDGLGSSVDIWTPHLQNMTELRELSLSDCSLSRTIEHLAAVLRQMPIVADLNLSHNSTLGANAGTWAASLQLMIPLKFLNLSNCGINQQDIPHIASVVGEMPNVANLNLSSNLDLGGNEGTWAASLQRMIHLKSLDLSHCGINEQDIPHIASSVGEMPNLADLNLSYNHKLDGKEGKWSASLQSMTHLKKLDIRRGTQTNSLDIKYVAKSVSRMVNMVDCDFSTPFEVYRVHPCDDGIRLSVKHYSLTGEDTADILEVFSNRRDLVSLSLDCMSGLVGSENVWTPPLQKILHLKDLRLTRCSLQSTDIEPIAAAVSRMPTVESLSLEQNRYLGGFSKTWAPSLRLMKHVNSLKLGYCSLTEEDKKHISGVWGSGVDFGYSEDD